MRWSGGRKAALAAGLVAAATVGLGLASWKRVLEEVHLRRLRADLDYALVLAASPEGSPERRALRRYFRSRPAREAEAAGEDEVSWGAPDLLESIDPRVSILAEAGSWEELLCLAKPTFSWNGRDLLWVRQGTDGKPAFALNRAFVLERDGEEPRWVLLEAGQDSEPFMDMNLDFAPSAVAPSKIESRGPTGESAYEIEWESIPGAVCYWQRTLYVLRESQGSWRFLGEGPSRSYDRFVRSRQGVTAEIEWTHLADAPVRVRFLEWRADESPDGGKVYHDSVLDEELPARVRYLGSAYVIAREGDTLDAIASRLVGHSEEGSPDLAWRIGLLEMNSWIPEGELRAGTRLRLPEYRELHGESGVSRVAAPLGKPVETPSRQP